MHNNSFFKTLLLLVSILLFASCDKDYNEIGDALIGENHFDLSKENYSVVAYNQKITPIQSDDLPINALGIYDNPAFGKTTANFATQLIMASVNPTIGANPEIDDVYLDVPYFVDASKTVPISSGGNTYELDSIYGASTAKIKLSVFESGYYMNDLDPANGLQSPQKYYTNQNDDFENLKIGNRLNDDSSTAQNDAFFFDPAQHSVTTTDAAGKVTTTYSAPSMRLKLNKAFFDSKIIHAPAGSLATNDVFKDYFRGLYFKVEQSGTDPGSLAMINFAKGTITIKYKEDLASTTGGAPTRVEKSIILNMLGNTVSLLNQSNTNIDYSNATSNANPTLGDEKLYLKGGEGSLAIIELFGPDNDNNGVADELEAIRNNGWLINEANLVFNIDASTMEDSYEPDRIYLYDFTNSLPVLDYFVDGSAAVRPKMSKLVFDGNINKDAVSKRGSTYKIRITNHIRNLINEKDSKNVKLGVVVTEDIAIANFNSLKTPTILPYPFKEAPKASVMNPLGTVLYGGKSSVEDGKRLKLEIYYTKPN
jgi:Domain of unknown function (DUF4270)